MDPGSMVPCARRAWLLVCLAGCGAPGVAADAETTPEPDAATPPFDTSALPAPHDAAPPQTPDAAPDAAREAAADAAATSSFQPCPAGAPCRILPLGDSLTFGVGSSGAGGGYRVPLFHRARAAGRSLTFVGSQANGPDSVDGAPFPRAHDGYRGYAIEPGGGREGLASIVAKVVGDARPQVVLLLAGTNDVGATVIDPARAPDRLGALIDRVAAAAPDALVVVARLPPSMTDAANVRIQAFNEALPAVVAARVQAGRHLLLVDAYAALAAHPDYKKALLFNEFHPNDAGYALVADRWYEAIEPFLR